MRALIVILCSLLCMTNVAAQTDSVSIMWGNRSQVVAPVDMKISNRQFNMNRLHHSFSLAVPVAAVGFAMMPADHAISRRVSGGMPNFNTSVDDYLRFAPLATQLAMSLSGVEGRSKNRWQVVATDAMATAMMATMVYGLKFGVDRTRPNGEGGRFPLWPYRHGIYGRHPVGARIRAQERVDTHSRIFRCHGYGCAEDIEQQTLCQRRARGSGHRHSVCRVGILGNGCDI